MLERCFLHIGAPKTGSTSIQQSLWESRDTLQAKGIHYPAISANHGFLVDSFVNQPEKRHLKARNKNRVFSRGEKAAHDRAAFEEALTASNCHTLVLSSEHLVLLDAAAVGRLQAYLGSLARQIQVVMYLRHPLAALGSAMQEIVKNGTNRLAALSRNPPLLPLREFLPHWADAFGKPQVLLREMHADALAQGDVVDDFLTVIGFPGDLREVKHVRANSSLSAPAVLIADALIALAPRASPARAAAPRIQEMLRLIAGPPFVPEPETCRRAAVRSRPHLNYLNQEWGLKLRPPPKARQAAGVVFDDATVQSLASLVLEVSATRALLQRRVRDSAEPETSGATEAQDSL